MIDIPKPETYTHPMEVTDVAPEGECISYQFAKEFDQTAAYRIRKYKPGKNMGYAEDTLPEAE